MSIRHCNVEYSHASWQRHYVRSQPTWRLWRWQACITGASQMKSDCFTQNLSQTCIQDETATPVATQKTIQVERCCTETYWIWILSPWRPRCDSLQYCLHLLHPKCFVWTDHSLVIILSWNSCWMCQVYQTSNHAVSWTGFACKIASYIIKSLNKTLPYNEDKHLEAC